MCYFVRLYISSIWNIENILYQYQRKSNTKIYLTHEPNYVCDQNNATAKPLEKTFCKWLSTWDNILRRVIHEFNFYRFQRRITWKFLLFLNVQQLMHKLYILLIKKTKKRKKEKKKRKKKNEPTLKNMGNVTRVYTSHPQCNKKPLQTWKYNDTTS